MLLGRETFSEKGRLLQFQNALALQCFTNEYIYGETEEETLAIKELEAKIDKAFYSGEELCSYDIACLASYRPLYSYSWASDMAPRDGLDSLLLRQVIEIQQERNLKKDITILNPIEDDVSKSVRAQYEENPYPRWINTKLELEKCSIQKMVENLQLNPGIAIDHLSDTPQILIAGCGTGQHSLVTASRFKDSQVTAIDLSISSLAYAKRKTEELGVTNIDYMQADILDLGLLDKHFDIVESVGVIHHMDEPIAGWRVLTDCLKPGGLMRLGLYSELARQSVVKARNIVTEDKILVNYNDMSLFRRRMIEKDNPLIEFFRRVGDFYSMSNFRDLLFHVQEHRFTIPQISEILNELGLVSLGLKFLIIG